MFYKALDYSPDLIIIPINWRMFGPDLLEDKTYFNPELSGFVPLRSELPPGYMDPVRSSGISTLSQAQYKTHRVTLYLMGMKLWGREKAKAYYTRLMKALGNPVKEQRFRGYGTRARRFSANAETMSRLYPMEISESNVTHRRLQALAYVISKHDTKVLFFI
jgi:hypothetical protein